MGHLLFGSVEPLSEDVAVGRLCEQIKEAIANEAFQGIRPRALEEIVREIAKGRSKEVNGSSGANVNEYNARLFRHFAAERTRLTEALCPLLHSQRVPRPRAPAVQVLRLTQGEVVPMQLLAELRELADELHLTAGPDAVVDADGSAKDGEVAPSAGADSAAARRAAQLADAAFLRAGRCLDSLHLFVHLAEERLLVDPLRSAERDDLDAYIGHSPTLTSSMMMAIKPFKECNYPVAKATSQLIDEYLLRPGGAYGRVLGGRPYDQPGVDATADAGPNAEIGSAAATVASGAGAFAGASASSARARAHYPCDWMRDACSPYAQSIPLFHLRRRKCASDPSNLHQLLMQLSSRLRESASTSTDRWASMKPQERIDLAVALAKEIDLDLFEDFDSREELVEDMLATEYGLPREASVVSTENKTRAAAKRPLPTTFGLNTMSRRRRRVIDPMTTAMVHSYTLTECGDVDGESDDDDPSNDGLWYV